MASDTQAITGALRVHYALQDIAARNIANLETPGFKRVMARIISTTRTDGGSTSERPEVGGVQLDLSQGSLVPTGNELDVALQGDGFFIINTENGPRYTRNGSFTLDGNGVLVTQSGDKVVGDHGDIQLPPGANVTISRNGTVQANGLPIGSLSVVRFEHPEQLRQAGGSLYAGDNAAPKPVDPTDPTLTIHQGALERANVDAVTELVEMMTSFREYEACTRSLSAMQQAATQLYQWARQ